MFFGIHFSCNITGDAVPDTLASDYSGLFQLQLILFEVLRKVSFLLDQKFSTEIFNI